MGLSQIGGASYNRLVTKQNIAGETSFVVTVNSPGGGTPGSWGELASATGVEYAITTVSLISPTTITTTWAPLYVSIGYGASGAETVLGQIYARPVGIASGGTNYVAAILPLAVPWRVASGVRLAARVTANNNVSGGNTGWDVAISAIPWASLEGN